MINGGLSQGEVCKYMKFRADKNTELELQKCPHLLVGGCTGSGKSYLMKNMLCDILRDDEDARIFVVDPKCVDYQFLQTRNTTLDGQGLLPEFLFEGLSKEENMEIKQKWLMKGVSLMTRDQIESGFVERLLGWVIDRMNARYRSMMERGLVLWDGYPIIVMIDELADLIYWDRDKERDKEHRGRIERLLVKIATLGRAAKVHLILGTQRPDATVLSGQLRANIPTRICLKVNNDTERRIILGVGKKEVGGDERVLYYNGEYKGLIRDLK